MAKTMYKEEETTNKKKKYRKADNITFIAIIIHTHIKEEAMVTVTTKEGKIYKYVAMCDDGELKFSNKVEYIA